ncbi:MAG: MoxR family ATPase [Candidatus Omnitrophica bacterium]|nr:MoxR family ATPase [Candidatus Omnitrophota bacterium]MCA9436617.1 MoxR family ATPase [Candidatus Omnitrophota bacterium]
MEEQAAAKAAEFKKRFHQIEEEIAKVIVGHHDIVEGVLTCFFAGGHALLEGVPGLGKTLLIKTLSEVTHLDFSRIQFTPDLMPADIIGTDMVAINEHGNREFKFEQGPVFANLLLADEINRATPKTQSALLEAMQEKSVTVGGNRYALDEPFLVMATQNPLEMEGTYPLPEAQLDRFFFKLLLKYPSRGELQTILSRTTTTEIPQPERVIDAAEILQLRNTVKEVPVAPHVYDYAVRLVLASHPGSEFAVSTVNQFVRVGSSPRGAQVLILGAKIRALLNDRFNVSFDDISKMAHPGLRHRLILNFEGEAEGVTPDQVIDEIVEKTPKSMEVAA